MARVWLDCGLPCFEDTPTLSPFMGFACSQYVLVMPSPGREGAARRGVPVRGAAAAGGERAGPAGRGRAGRGGGGGERGPGGEAGRGRGGAGGGAAAVRNKFFLSAVYAKCPEHTEKDRKRNEEGEGGEEAICFVLTGVCPLERSCHFNSLQHSFFKNHVVMFQVCGGACSAGGGRSGGRGRRGGPEGASSS